MKQYRKKPVVIEAMQFNTLDDYLTIVQWMQDSGDTQALRNEVYYETPIMKLHTLEGLITANPGDYIIKGIMGEFYPCKPYIFAATYEEVEPTKGESVPTVETGISGEETDGLEPVTALGEGV